MVRQGVPRHSIEVLGGADTHLQSVEDPTMEKVDVPDESCSLWRVQAGAGLLESLLLAETVAHREELLQKQVFWQNLWPAERSCTGAVHSHGGMYPVGRTHTKEVPEVQQPMGRTCTGEVNERFYPTGGTLC